MDPLVQTDFSWRRNVVITVTRVMVVVGGVKLTRAGPGFPAEDAIDQPCKHIPPPLPMLMIMSPSWRARQGR